MRDFATHVNRKQPGGPRKLAQALIRLANAATPPVHLLLGKDTLASFREKTAQVEKDIEARHEIVTGTDHDDVAHHPYWPPRTVSDYSRMGAVS